MSGMADNNEKKENSSVTAVLELVIVNSYVNAKAALVLNQFLL